MTDQEYERRLLIRQRAEDIIRQLGKDINISRLTYIECCKKASILLQREIDYCFRTDKEYVF